MTQDIDTNKILSALSHGSIFFSSLVVAVGIPIVILAVSNDSTVKNNAKEALNFHLNMWLYYIIAGILTLVLIGWLLLPIIAIFNVVMPIIAIIQILGNPNQVYRYPFIFRVF
jgi:uncharacterized Tic20 family protein